MSWHGPSAPRVEGIATKSGWSQAARRSRHRRRRGFSAAYRHSFAAAPVGSCRGSGVTYPNPISAAGVMRKMGIAQCIFEQSPFRIAAQRRRPLDAIEQPRTRFRRGPARCAPECARHRSAVHSPHHRRRRLSCVILAEACSISIAITAVALISCFVLCRRLAVRSGKNRSTIATSARAFSSGVGDEVGGAERHHRAVVGRMVEAASGQHQAVEMRDGETDLLAGRLVPQHAAGAAAVPVQLASLPARRTSACNRAGRRSRRRRGTASRRPAGRGSSRGRSEPRSCRRFTWLRGDTGYEWVVSASVTAAPVGIIDRSIQLYRRIWSAIVPIPCEKFRPILRRRRARPSFRSTFQGRTSRHGASSPAPALSGALPRHHRRHRKTRRTAAAFPHAGQAKPVSVATPSRRPMSG